MAQMLQECAEIVWIHKNENLSIMYNFDDITGENTQEHNPNWP